MYIFDFTMNFYNDIIFDESNIDNNYCVIDKLNVMEYININSS